MTPLLEVKNVKKSYGGKFIVNGLSFFVYPGEVVGLLGPNGAGKTTAFYLTIGLIRCEEGQVIFKGTDISQMAMHKRAQMGMGYLAQEPSIFHTLSVEDNILCVLETLPLNPQEKKERLSQLLEELHLTHLRKKRATCLSGGERRRLEITRALVREPSLLLLDEPFANIDPITVQEVKHLIHLLKKKEISILITDHNAREIFSTVDRSYLIQEGKVSFSGSVQDLISNPEVRSGYLGENFQL